MKQVFLLAYDMIKLLKAKLPEELLAQAETVERRQKLHEMWRNLEV